MQHQQTLPRIATQWLALPMTRWPGYPMTRWCGGTLHRGNLECQIRERAAWGKLHLNRWIKAIFCGLPARHMVEMVRAGWPRLPHLLY